MRIKTGLAFKKAVFLLLAILTFWQLFRTVKSEMSFFPIFKVFSVELFLSQRLNPAKMIDQVSNDIIQNVQGVWKKHQLEIVYVREQAKKKTADNILKQKPCVVIFYEEKDFDGRETKEFVRASLNSNLASLIRKRGQKESSFGYAFRLTRMWNKMLSEAKSFSLSDYEKIKEEFPKIQYSFEELRQLRIAGVNLTMLNSLVHFIEEKCRFDEIADGMNNYKESKDLLTNQSLLAYALYFYENKFAYCWLESFRQKGAIALAILFFAFLIACLLQKDAGILLDEELGKRKLQMNWSYRLRTAKYWKFMLSAAKEHKRRLDAGKICDRYEEYLDEKQFKQIAREAEMIWDKLSLEIGEGLSKRKDLQTLYQISLGNGKNGSKAIVSCRNALNVLKTALEKTISGSTEKNDTGGSYKLNFTGSPRTKYQSRRRGLGWKKLTRAKAGEVSAKSIADPIIEEVNNPSIDVFCEKAERMLPENLKVIIIGGDRLYGRKQELVEAVMTLGPKSVEFREVKGVRQVKAAARTDPQNTLIVLAHVPHGYGKLIYNREGLRWLFIEPISCERFKDKVIDGYYGLQ